MVRGYSSKGGGGGGGCWAFTSLPNMGFVMVRRRVCNISLLPPLQAPLNPSTSTPTPFLTGGDSLFALQRRHGAGVPATSGDVSKLAEVVAQPGFQRELRGVRRRRLSRRARRGRARGVRGTAQESALKMRRFLNHLSCVGSSTVKRQR